jgi:hypothetical protein
VDRPVHPVTAALHGALLSGHEEPRVRELAEMALDLAKVADAARQFLRVVEEVNGPEFIFALARGHRPTEEALRKLRAACLGEVERG